MMQRFGWEKQTRAENGTILEAGRSTASQIDYAKYIFPSMDMADIITRCGSA
jgi:hypothetical protein